MFSRAKTAQVFLLLVAVLLAFGAVSHTVFSQSTSTGSVTITKVDATKFPNMQFWVAATDPSGKAIPGLTDTDLTIFEDGNRVSASIEKEKRGVALTVILDTSGNVWTKGVMKGKGGIRTRLDEIRVVVDRLMLTKDPGWLDQEQRTDWVQVLAPTGSTTITTVVPFTNDYTYVHNQVYLFQPSRTIKNTPLFHMVFQAINTMQADAELASRNKAIIIFSDGIDVVSEVVLNDVVKQATAARIPLHTVLLGPEKDTGKKNLYRLSTRTSGQYYHLTAENTLDPLFDLVAGQRDQYKVQYRSLIYGSGDHVLAAKLSSTWGGDEDSHSFPITVKPPHVLIISPPSGYNVERKAASWDTPPEEIEPRMLPQPIQIQWDWPDGHPRNIVRAEFAVDNQTYPVAHSPFDSFTPDISTLKGGDHTLRAYVVDELGLRGESAPLPIHISLNIPKPPPPPPPPIWERVLGYLGGVVSLVALAISFGALLLAIIIYRSRPQIVDQVATTAGKVVSRVKEATEVFFLDSKVGTRPAKAYLITLTGNENRHQPVKISSENVRLGRDAALSTFAFSDRTVSRLHARISEDQDGVFRIYDEGSTSGTYVNYEQVPVDGQWLQHNDLINLGRLQLQFKLRSSMPLEEIKMVEEGKSVADVKTDSFRSDMSQSPGGQPEGAYDKGATQVKVSKPEGRHDEEGTEAIDAFDVKNDLSDQDISDLEDDVHTEPMTEMDFRQEQQKE